MTKLNITVTQQDIDAGECGKPRRCAIALAANRAGLFGTYISTLLIRGYVNGPKGRLIGKLPKEARQFIATFDAAPTNFIARQCQAAPFSFTVELHPDTPRRY